MLLAGTLLGIGGLTWGQEPPVLAQPPKSLKGAPLPLLIAVTSITLG